MRQRASWVRFQEGESPVGGMYEKGLKKEIKLELELEGRLKCG